MCYININWIIFHIYIPITDHRTHHGRCPSTIRLSLSIRISLLFCQHTAPDPCEIYIVEPERRGIYNIENIQLFDYIAPHTLYANFRQIVSIQFIVFVCGFKCCWPITIYCGFHRNRNAKNCLTIEQFLLNVKQHQQKKHAISWKFFGKNADKLRKKLQKIPQAIEEKKFARKYFTIFPFCAYVCIFRNYGMLLVQCSYSFECVIISFMCNTYATRAKCLNLRHFHL